MGNPSILRKPDTFRKPSKPVGYGQFIRDQIEAKKWASDVLNEDNPPPVKKVKKNKLPEGGMTGSGYKKFEPKSW